LSPSPKKGTECMYISMQRADGMVEYKGWDTDRITGQATPKGRKINLDRGLIHVSLIKRTPKQRQRQNQKTTKSQQSRVSPRNSQCRDKTTNHRSCPPSPMPLVAAPPELVVRTIPSPSPSVFLLFLSMLGLLESLTRPFLSSLGNSVGLEGRFPYE
jgi:hypothetical protein